MTRVAAVLLDILVVALLAVVFLIIVTGGGVFHVGAVRIRAHGVENPLLLTGTLIVLRYALRQWTTSRSPGLDWWIGIGVALVTERIPGGVTRLFSKPITALALLASVTFAIKVELIGHK